MRKKPTFDLWSDSIGDSTLSDAAHEARLAEVESRIEAKRDAITTIELARLHTQASDLLLELERPDEAWERARPKLPVFIGAGCWVNAINICDILFRCELADSLVALGHGTWLAVTYPVEPALTLTMLQYIIEETPDDSDGAAVAAATGAWICDLRKSESDDSGAELQSMEMLTRVARRHSGIEGQREFDQWIRQLELDNPEKFLVRLRNVIDVLVQDDWWFDRELLQENIADEEFTT